MSKNFKNNCNHLIDTAQALDLVEKKTGIKITLPTMISWVKKNNLGSQPYGKRGLWYVDRNKLLNHLKSLRKKKEVCYNAK
jgi:hypothetical protein